MLYNVTHKPDRLVDPKDVASWDYNAAFARKANPRSYEKIMRTVRGEIEKLVAGGSNKLVWTKTGALLGHRSTGPHEAVNHLWNTVGNVMGPGKFSMKTVGALVCLAVAERSEKYWLLYLQETDDIDPDTGKKINVATYWIDPNYQPPKEATAQALADKFNKRR